MIRSAILALACLCTLAATAQTRDQIAGTYDWTSQSYIISLTGPQQSQITLAPDPDSDNGILISGLYKEYVISATYDPDAHTLVLPKQFVFNDPDYHEPAYLTLAHWAATGADTKTSDDPFIFTYDDGTFTSNPDDLLGIAISFGYRLLRGDNTLIKASDGISDLAAEDDQAALYFTLDGIPVTYPTSRGIYLRRTPSGSTTKVILR